MTKQKIFTRTIWMLSFLSLFNDIGSEMLIPVMPIYLKTIGFTALWIGVLEGFAEAVAGISKGYFGKLSDEKGKRLPFVQLGYTMSAIAKPLTGIIAFPLWVLFMRIVDRIGKGVRTGARDAMLSDECSKEHKGKVFGLHRSMDTVGAAIGPFIALCFLYFYPGEYKLLFLFAFFPGIVSILIPFLIKEKQKEPQERTDKGNFFSFFLYWNKASTGYKRLVVGLLAFAFFNSSDAFLLLMAKSSGLSDLQIISVYIFYNLVYALFAYPMGVLGDRIGMKRTLIIGLLLFVVVYGGMAYLQSVWMMMVLFFVYGIYAAISDGISKAWIAKISPHSETGTAIGFYTSCISIMAMISSSVAGLIWVSASASIMFLFAAIGVAGTIIYFCFFTERE